ncbi:MAG: hypothetical protein OQK04_02025, partial [Kangiellaceae bacterium]|nr:hypothetical protein [Kangiellaceae bacterium]
MSDKKSPSTFSQILVGVSTMFFGSFIFAGVIEGYKNEAGKNEKVISDYFRPMRVAQTACSASHNRLFLSYGEMSGTYQLIYDELQHMMQNRKVRNSIDYQVIPMSIFKTFTELS